MVFACLPVDCFYLVNRTGSKGLFNAVLFGFVGCVSSLLVVFRFLLVCDFVFCLLFWFDY